MERWQSKWYPIGSKCTGLERTTSQTNISLAQAQGAFYILGIGLVMATLCLVIERLYQIKRWRIRIGERKQTENPRITHVGRMAPRISVKTNGDALKFQNTQFLSPFETVNGHLYTYGESSTDNEIQEHNNETTKKKGRKSTSCPDFFGCCAKQESDDDISSQNGKVLNLRSAFSDTLWNNKQKTSKTAANGVQSNGVIKQNGASQSHSGFTFESIRDIQPSIANGKPPLFTFESVRESRRLQKNKDAETGEVSSNPTIYSIRL